MPVPTVLRAAPALVLATTFLLQQPASAQIGGRLRGAVDRAVGRTPQPSTPQQVPGELNLQRPPANEFMRLSGTWASPLGTLRLEHTYFGGMTGTLTPTGGGAAQPIILYVDEDGTTADGVWGARGGTGQAPVKIRLLPDGNTLEARSGHPRLAGHPDVWSAVRDISTVPPSRWVGTWDTTLGLMTVTTESDHLLGTIAGGNLPGGRISPRALAFAEIKSKAKAGGAWRDTSTLEQGLLLWQMSADGSKFFGTYTRRINDVDVEEAWSGNRIGGGNGFEQVPAIPASLLARYEGDWKTQPGTMRIARQGAGAVMMILGHTGLAVTSAPLEVGASGQTLEASLAGWPDPGSRRVRLLLTPDGTDFEAWELTGGGDQKRILWSGYSEARRKATQTPSPQPAPSAPSPIVGPPAVPPAVPPVASPEPARATAFKPLNRVDVLVDRIVVARGYPTHQVHAFVTVKNVSPGLLYFTSGFLKALLTDADGVSIERSQPYRASGEPAELFPATPVIQPGRELKVRYVFTPPEDAQLTSLTLSEGAKRAEFPVTGL